MATDTLCMGRKKAESRTTPDREKYRKPAKAVRIRSALARIGEVRAEQLAQDFTQYVNDALRMRLEAEGCWPPPRA